MVGVFMVVSVLRANVAQRAQERTVEKQALVDMLIDEASRKYQLVHGYSKRSVMNDMFSQAVGEYTKVRIPESIAALNTRYITKFLSGVFIAIYIVVKTPAVLNNELSLGIFLATISIFATDLANAITEFNAQLILIISAFFPLKEFTMQLNLPLALAANKKVNQD